jgi:4,5-dihydroxyphthalate decarboxylase
MVESLPISIAVHDSARHRRVLDGGLRLPGFTLRTIPLAAGEMYSRAFDEPGIDVAEMSIARYARLHSQGECQFVALPYYFAREFQHASFYALKDHPAKHPSQLAGMKIGLSEYDHTGHTWSRALLQDEFGVPPQAVHWIIARREATRPPIRHYFQAPEGVRIDYAPDDKFLSQMLLDGEIDAMINPGTPNCFKEHPDRVHRLIADHRQAERDYFERTGICPIQHVLGVRKALLAEHPWLGEALVAEFIAAVGASRSIWEPQGPSDRVPEVLLHGLGKDERNSLGTFLRHHAAQGLSGEPIPVEAFFTPS